jgi:hypothetical protein
MDLSSFTQLPSLNLIQNHLLAAAFSSLQSSPALSTLLPFVMPSSTEQGKKKTSMSAVETSIWTSQRMEHTRKLKAQAPLTQVRKKGTTPRHV